MCMSLYLKQSRQPVFLPLTFENLPTKTVDHSCNTIRISLGVFHGRIGLPLSSLLASSALVRSQAGDDFSSVGLTSEVYAVLSTSLVHFPRFFS